MYVRLLIFISKIGLKKTAVKLAYFMERYSFTCYDAQNYLYSSNTRLPYCTECGLPVLSDTDARHTTCRAAIRSYEVQEDLDAEMAALEAEMRREDAERLQELLDSFCTEDGCYEEAVNWTGKCIAHDTTCHWCSCDPCECIDIDEDVEDDCRECGYPVSRCDCQQECPNGCGQPAYACTCAEIESWHRFQADPATRGSWWTP